MLEKVKLALRITSDAFDEELNDMISAASADLEASGVDSAAAVDYSEPLVVRAVITYVKANFGWNNPDAERLTASYDLQAQKLALVNRGDDNALA